MGAGQSQYWAISTPRRRTGLNQTCEGCGNNRTMGPVWRRRRCLYILRTYIMYLTFNLPCRTICVENVSMLVLQHLTTTKWKVHLELHTQVHTEWYTRNPTRGMCYETCTLHSCLTTVLLCTVQIQWCIPSLLCPPASDSESSEAVCWLCCFKFQTHTHSFQFLNLSKDSY
jgi:hypothetical protein